jgi:hypothetical protein
MKTHHNIITACLSILLVMNCMGNELPPEAKRLEQQRNEAVLKIDTNYSKELEKIKLMYTKRGDLEAANAIKELIDNVNVVVTKKLDTSFPESIISKRWSWITPVTSGQIVFNDNNKAKFNWGELTWRITGKHEITLEARDGNTSVITFNEDLTKYTGMAFKNRQSGSRETLNGSIIE